MKKFLIFILLCATMRVYAQNEHLKFKGVPINGTRNEFVQKMKAAGFTYLGTEEDITFLKGDFAGIKSCTVAVTTLKGRDLVSRIAVVFPECDTWQGVESYYQDLKVALSKKYGEPADSVETFHSKYISDNNDKMFALLMNKCEYWCSFETQNGTIKLSIEKDGINTGVVLLRYIDKINDEIIQQDAINDL